MVGTVVDVDILLDQFGVLLDDPPDWPPFNIVKELPCFENELELINAD